MNEICSFAPFLYNEILFKIRRAHAGKVGDYISLGERRSGAALLCEYRLDALGVRCEILFLVGLDRVGAGEDISVDGVQQPAALGMGRIALELFDGSYRAYQRAGFFIEN